MLIQKVARENDSHTLKNDIDFDVCTVYTCVLNYGYTPYFGTCVGIDLDIIYSNLPILPICLVLSKPKFISTVKPFCSSFVYLDKKKLIDFRKLTKV